MTYVCVMHTLTGCPASAPPSASCQAHNRHNNEAPLTSTATAWVAWVSTPGVHARMLLPPTTPAPLSRTSPRLQLCLQLLVLISGRTHARMSGAAPLLLLLLPVLLLPAWPAPAAAMLPDRIQGKPVARSTDRSWPCYCCCCCPSADTHLALHNSNT